MFENNRTDNSSYSLQETQEETLEADRSLDTSASSTVSPETFSDKISYAFQLATAQGPLCHEPIRGIAVFLEDVTVSSAANEDASGRDNLGRLTGEVIKTVRDSIQQGFLEWSPRLLLAMYSCEVQASSKSRSADRIQHCVNTSLVTLFHLTVDVTEKAHFLESS